LAEKQPEEHVLESNANQSRDEERYIASTPAYVDDDGEEHYNVPAETAEDLVTEVIHVRDDPTLNPWTFRVWFLGRYDL